MCKHFCGIWLGAVAANSNKKWIFVRTVFSALTHSLNLSISPSLSLSFSLYRSHSYFVCCVQYNLVLLCLMNFFPRTNSKEKATSHCYCDLVVGNSKRRIEIQWKMPLIGWMFQRPQFECLNGRNWFVVSYMTSDDYHNQCHKSLSNAWACPHIHLTFENWLLMV